MEVLFLLRVELKSAGPQVSTMVLHERFAVLNLSLARHKKITAYKWCSSYLLSVRVLPSDILGRCPTFFPKLKAFYVRLPCKKLSKDLYGCLAEVSQLWSSQFWPFLLFQVHFLPQANLLYFPPLHHLLCALEDLQAVLHADALWEGIHPSSPCPFQRDSRQLQVTKQPSCW